MYAIMCNVRVLHINFSFATLLFVQYSFLLFQAIYFSLYNSSSILAKIKCMLLDM